MSEDTDSKLHVSVNQTVKTITLWDGQFGQISGNTVHHPVPADYNIFALLRIPTPKGLVDDDALRNWTVVFSQDSYWGEELERTYKVKYFKHTFSFVSSRKAYVGSSKHS